MLKSLSGIAPRSSWDVAIVGAGPAGIAAALEAADRGQSVVLVDSGDLLPDPHLTWRLGDTEVVGDDRFGVLMARINRAVGGTSWKWCIDLMGQAPGVRYAPVERGVLERRVEGAPSWPLSWEELAPWYDRALALAGVPMDVRALDQCDSDRLPGLEEARYAFGHASAFQGPAVLDRLTSAGVHVMCGGTMTELVPDAGGERITGVRLRSLDGADETIEARSFILAMGTIETTRALLLAQSSVAGLRGNRQIGRNLMDRPRVLGRLELHQAPPPWFERLALHGHRDGFAMDRFISPRESVRDGVASSSFILMPDFERGRVSPRVERAISRVVLDVPDRFTARVASRLPNPVRRTLMALHQRSYHVRSRLLRSVMATTYNTEWAGWTDDARWSNHRRWRMVAITEQPPHPHNRVTLSTERDALGIPKAVIEWGAPATLTESIGFGLDAASKAFARAGLGTVVWQPDLHAVSSCHMMGTVCIGIDPAVSAADPDGRVRGTANLYVAGNALIPQSGHGNPTLTAMALAMRTAARIAAPE